MKGFKIAAFAVLVVLIAGCAALDDRGQWQDLSGSFEFWNQAGDANWRLEDGEFVADSGQGFLVTKDSYQDFEIDLEFWADEPANSGIYMRIENPDAPTDTTAYEANIYDTRPDQTYATGALVHFSAPSQQMMAADKWNNFHITVRGDHIIIVMNGVKTVDTHTDAHMNAGPFGLQAYAGTLKFRDVRVRRL